MRRSLSILLLLPISVFLFLAIVVANDGTGLPSTEQSISEAAEESSRIGDDLSVHLRPGDSEMDDRDEETIEDESEDALDEDEWDEDEWDEDEWGEDEWDEEDGDLDVDDEEDDESHEEDFDDEEDDWGDDSESEQSAFRHELAVNLSDIVQSDRRTVAVALSEVREHFEEADAIELLEQALDRTENLTHRRMVRLHLVSLYVDSDQPSKAKAHAMALIVGQ